MLITALKTLRFAGKWPGLWRLCREGSELVGDAQADVARLEIDMNVFESLRASRASNAAEVQTNPDGSTDIFFGPKVPEGKETNWVPTDPQRGFELLFRLYSPTPALFEKKAWTLPDVEKVN